MPVKPTASYCDSDSVMFISFWILWTLEIVLTVTTHSLTLRLSMAHTLVLGLITAGHVWTNRRGGMERFLSLWFVLCYVGMVALCVVNLIHAVQMLTHRHDSGVHYAVFLFAVSALDLVVKLISLSFVDASFPKSSGGKICCVGFFITSSLTVFVIGLLRLLSSNGAIFANQLILWLDPGLTIVAALLVAVFVIQPLRDNALVMILAVPSHIDLDRLEENFRNKFPHCDSKDLRIYLQSRNEVNVSVSVRHKMKSGMSDDDSSNGFTEIATQMKDFFVSQGASGRVLVQPEFCFDRDGTDYCEEVGGATSVSHLKEY